MRMRGGRHVRVLRGLRLMLRVLGMLLVRRVRVLHVRPMRGRARVALRRVQRRHGRVRRVWRVRRRRLAACRVFVFLLQQVDQDAVWLLLLAKQRVAQPVGLLVMRRRRGGGRRGRPRRAALHPSLSRLLGRYIAEQRRRPWVQVKVPDRELRVAGTHGWAIPRLVRGRLAVGHGGHHRSADGRRTAATVHHLHVVVTEHRVRGHDEVGLARRRLGSEESRASADSDGRAVGGDAQPEGLAQGGRRGQTRGLGQVRCNASAVTTIH